MCWKRPPPGGKRTKVTGLWFWNWKFGASWRFTARGATGETNIFPNEFVSLSSLDLVVVWSSFSVVVARDRGERFCRIDSPRVCFFWFSLINLCVFHCHRVFKERENKLLTQSRKEKTFQFDNWSSRRRFAFVKELIKKRKKKEIVLLKGCA